MAGSIQGEGKHSMKTLQLLLERQAQLTVQRTFRSAGSVFLAYFTSQSGIELSSLRQAAWGLLSPPLTSPTLSSRSEASKKLLVLLNDSGFPLSSFWVPELNCLV